MHSLFGATSVRVSWPVDPGDLGFLRTASTCTFPVNAGRQRTEETGELSRTLNCLLEPKSWQVARNLTCTLILCRLAHDVAELQYCVLVSARSNGCDSLLILSPSDFCGFQ